MSDDWTVLVPVKVLEGEAVLEEVVELLATLPVVVMGYHVLPDQTPPGQARLQYEDRAQTILEDMAADFREAGGDAETRLVFTHDAEQSIDRVAEETGCGAVLIPNPASDVERLLVPLRGEVDDRRVVSFVAAMVGDRPIEVTLFSVAEDADVETSRNRLDEAGEVLREHGLSAPVTTEVVVSDAPVRAIADAAADHQTVVMGESAPSLRSFFFGEESEQVATQSLGPVVVVRRERENSEDQS